MALIHLTLRPPYTEKGRSLFAGEIQIETGESVSDNEALVEFIRRYQPDLYERLLKFEAEGKDEEDES